MPNQDFAESFSLASIVALLLVGCGSSETIEQLPDEVGQTQAASMLAASDDEPFEENISSSVWSYSQSIDPFTDARISSMKTQVEGDFALVNVEAKCSSTGKLSYRITAFDDKQRPLRMSRFPSATELQLGRNLIKTISYRIRIDDEEPGRGLVIDPRHDNSFVIGSKALSGEPTSDDIRRGRLITLGLTFDRGDDTIFINQTDQGFRSWINQCRADQSDGGELAETSSARKNQQQRCDIGESLEQTEACLLEEIDRLDDNVDAETYELLNKNCRWEGSEEPGLSLEHLKCLRDEIERFQS